MKHELYAGDKHRKITGILLVAVLPCLLLLAGWFSAQADQGAQSENRQSTPANGTVPSVVYLPLVEQSANQTVTLVTPQAAWSADWWSWAERTNSVPILEQGEVDCTLGQTGDVWFLAGTDGSAPVARSCTIPTNKTLMVPVHTAAWHNEGTENLTVAEKRVVLDEYYSDQVPGDYNTKICRVESYIYGQTVSTVRLQSPTFSFMADPEAVADGFWFAFTLSPGRYNVRFRGTLCDFTTNAPLNDVEVIYMLRVEEVEASAP
jgi:hypothetical protein